MSNPNPPSGGPPLRALAMVLIALAIVFAGLGAMSLSKSGSESSGSTPQGQAQSTGAPKATTTVAPPPVTSPAAAPTTTVAPTTAPPTTTPPPPPAGPDKSVPVRVLNNGTIAGLAARTGNQLSAAGWNVVETANYPNGVIAKSTVFYGNSPQEQAAAKAIAAELGVSAEPRFAGLADAPPGVIVIVTGN
ncbi:LytR C-terminal domain-containing protein [Nocardia sp. CDC159]|uniref:LytR C-terminal domain-containing protein n=1 Tax=Nocardia pulmonis TaxID=2951408 RepID=A0A9X2IZD9_9NOCA|nr:MULTISPECIES: LytR C-terminal domain-containing protein [Nocardia]MCM6777398.1 LytR C-terminal domain-containing protein [Nocardia pulmonis]MCM6790283.1 LytR C-terminal domain-containing protein [Nocardia sp. CDC159]